MKFLSFFFIISCSVLEAFAQVTACRTDSVEAIQGFRNLFRYQNFYISGQPAYETLLWLKERGAHTLINLRTENENNEFTDGAFNEERLSQEMGFSYIKFPVDGLQDYNPEKLKSFSDLLNANEIIVIHCASAIRATNFFMAYLIANRNYTIDEALAIGREMRFSLPLEKLLGAEIHMVPGTKIDVK